MQEPLNDGAGMDGAAEVEGSHGLPSDIRATVGLERRCV